MVKVNYKNALVNSGELKEIKARLLKAKEELINKSGLGKEYLGWIDWPIEYDKDEYKRIKAASKKIRDNGDIFIVIGIGGSYLGAKACIEAFKHSFEGLKEDKKPFVLFAGNNISSKYMADLLDVIKDKDIYVNIISKSGTTTEPAIGFRIIREFLEDKYGKEGARERIFATTDKEKGALKELSIKENYESFVIPDDIGGRFSILSPVGLLPLAVAGIDVDEILRGASAGREEYMKSPFEDNHPLIYGGIRNILYEKGKDIEILVNYEANLKYLGEWWKQLFGESEGKDGKGIYPASANFTTDLHSLGQIIQDGKRNIFETVINIEKAKEDIVLKKLDEDLDGLNYLGGKTLDYVNKQAFRGTVMAHVKGQVPNIIIDIPELNEYYFGKLIYFFQFACGVSAYTLGVNPFNQPGVEEYKKNMFTLLGK